MANAKVIRRASELVMSATGVQLGPKQAGMVEGRIKRRMIDLGLESSEEYERHLDGNDEEVSALVSLLTTHHTYFFREFAHFEFLEKTALPALILAKRKKGERHLKVWSAACSRGQEVYSLSMMLQGFFRSQAPEFTFEILGTDVDPESIAIAGNGVFQSKEIKEIPLQYLNGNWARGKGDISDFYKAKAGIKGPCRFEVANLAEAKTFPSATFDIIFCRNVFIYFAQEQIVSSVREFLKRLDGGGYLFLGISESVNGLGLAVSPVGPSIYVHQGAFQAPRAVSLPREERILNVFCIDDSPTILSLLQQILVPECGFKVVGTAVNGLDAAKKLKDCKADLVTLDIHMPGQDGLGYLRANHGANHPPVVMISSVPREDAELAMRCLDLGAKDYVEKPTLANFRERGEEIRLKLRCAHRLSIVPSPRPPIELPFHETAAEGSTLDTGLRLIVCRMSDRARFTDMIRALPKSQGSTVVLVEGSGAALEPFARRACSTAGLEPVFPAEEESGALQPGKVAWTESVSTVARFRMQLPASQRAVAILFGNASSAVSSELLSWKLKGVPLILEDLGRSGHSPALQKAASEIVPVASFAYHARRHLAARGGKS